MAANPFAIDPVDRVQSAERSRLEADAARLTADRRRRPRVLREQMARLLDAPGSSRRRPIAVFTEIGNRHVVPRTILAAIAERQGVDPGGDDLARYVEATAQALAARREAGEAWPQAVRTVLGPSANDDLAMTVLRRADAMTRAIEAQQQPINPPEPEPEPEGLIGGTARRVGDLGRQFAAGAVQGTGMVATGIDALLSALEPTEVRSGSVSLADLFPGEAIGRAASGLADDIRNSVSERGRAALAGSQPSGDLFRPDTWSWGENPSIEGIALLTVDALGSMAPVLAAGAASGGIGAALGGTGRVAAAVGGATAGGAQSAGAGAEEGEHMIRQMAEDGRLADESRYYRRLVEQGVAPAEALERTVEAARQMGALFAAPVGAAGGAATIAIANPAVRIASRRGIVGRTAARAGLGAVEEGTQEALEGVAARSGANVGAGTDESVTERTFGDAVLGALAGGTFGGLAGATSRREPLALPPPSDAPPSPEVAGIAALEGELQRAAAAAQAASTPEERTAAVERVRQLHRELEAARTSGSAPPAGPLGRAAASGPARTLPAIEPGERVTIEDEAFEQPVTGVMVAETPDGPLIRADDGEELVIPRADLTSGMTRVRSCPEAWCS